MKRLMLSLVMLTLVFSAFTITRSERNKTSDARLGDDYIGDDLTLDDLQKDRAVFAAKTVARGLPSRHTSQYLTSASMYTLSPQLTQTKAERH